MDKELTAGAVSCIQDPGRLPGIPAWCVALIMPRTRICTVSL